VIVAPVISNTRDHQADPELFAVAQQLCLSVVILVVVDRAVVVRGLQIAELPANRWLVRPLLSICHENATSDSQCDAHEKRSADCARKGAAVHDESPSDLELTVMPVT
jgi:hypothetical protein